MYNKYTNMTMLKDDCSSCRTPPPQKQNKTKQHKKETRTKKQNKTKQKSKNKTKKQKQKQKQKQNKTYNILVELFLWLSNIYQAYSNTSKNCTNQNSKKEKFFRKKIL